MLISQGLVKPFCCFLICCAANCHYIVNEYLHLFNSYNAIFYLFAFIVTQKIYSDEFVRIPQIPYVKIVSSEIIGLYGHSGGVFMLRSHHTILN